MFSKKEFEEFDVKKGLYDLSKNYQLSDRSEYEEDVPDMSTLIDTLANDQNVKDLKVLNIGVWSEAWDSSCEDLVKKLVEYKDRFSGIEELYLADMDQEECEISWIQLSSITPLYEAFPNLKTLYIKGAEGLELGRINLPKLETLVIHCGGLDKEILDSIIESDLSNLKELEIWFGVQDYGFNCKPEDFVRLLEGDKFPSLEALGLMNSEIQDEIVEAVANVGLPPKVMTLDFSMGTMRNAGVKALLEKKDVFSNIKSLNLESNYIDEDHQKQLIAAYSSEVVCLDEQKEADMYDDEEYYYVEVSE